MLGFKLSCNHNFPGLCFAQSMTAVTWDDVILSRQLNKKGNWAVYILLLLSATQQATSLNVTPATAAKWWVEKLPLAVVTVAYAKRGIY